METENRENKPNRVTDTFSGFVRKLYDLIHRLPEEREHQWDGLLIRAEGCSMYATDMEHIHTTQPMDDPDAPLMDSALKIMSASVNLSYNMIHGTNIVAVAGNTTDKLDAEIVQEWTEIVRFIHQICGDVKKQVQTSLEAPSKAQHPEMVYLLNQVTGSLNDTLETAKDQYERCIRVNLHGPLAKQAVASALEIGLVQPPTGSMTTFFGTYQTVADQSVILERIPDGQLLQLPVSLEEAQQLQRNDSRLWGKPVVYCYTADQQVYCPMEPMEFANKCREMAMQRTQTGEHQEWMEVRREYLESANKLWEMANQIEKTLHPESSAAPSATITSRLPERGREEIVASAITKMNQAFGYTKTDASKNAAEDHSDKTTFAGPLPTITDPDMVANGQYPKPE